MSTRVHVHSHSHALLTTRSRHIAIFRPDSALAGSVQAGGHIQPGVAAGAYRIHQCSRNYYPAVPIARFNRHPVALFIRYCAHYGPPW